MIRILVNDGIHLDGKKMLEEAGFEVVDHKIPQDQLVEKLNAFDAICVRSATKVRKELIDASPNLKVIARGGVGLDNIDVEYAKSKGINVINTPAASSRSVAELVFGHMINCARFLHNANREMPLKGTTEFGILKKSYAKGAELYGRNLGLMGMGRIGQEVIKLGIGFGMNILAHDPYISSVEVEFGSDKFKGLARIDGVSKETLLENADFITLHVPFNGTPVLSYPEFNMMKSNVILVNAARGGVVNEDALMEALNSGKIAGTGADVFENEPTPRKDLLQHEKVCLSPHIGASTLEAQRNVGTQLASQLIALLSN